MCHHPARPDTTGFEHRVQRLSKVATMQPGSIHPSRQPWLGTAAAMAVVWLLASIPALAGGIDDTFSRNAVDTSLWRTCQADPALIGFGIDAATGHHYLAMKIDGKHEDPGSCTTVANRDLMAEIDTLGPSFFANASTMAAIAGFDCPRPEERNGEPIIQRNELRFAPADLYPDIRQDTWYSLTFKLKGYGGDTIPACGSARWVIGQWKYEHMMPGFNGSPFLAQRFDNGILHLTVEDDGCRCMIAKVGGDPDFSNAPEDTSLVRVPPLRCRYSEGDQMNQRCQPTHLKLMAADLSTLATLPDPKIDWVRMTYRIRAGGPEGARIDVYANGRFIVRAEGDIDPHIPGNRIKFKIGHYRDKIPVKAELLLQEVCVSSAAKTCSHGLKVLP